MGSSHTEGQVVRLRCLKVLQTIQPPELIPEEPGVCGSKESSTNQASSGSDLAELTDRSKSRMLGMAGFGYSENPRELGPFFSGLNFPALAWAGSCHVVPKMATRSPELQACI